MKKNKLFYTLIGMFFMLNYSLIDAQCSLLCNTDFENNQIAGTTVTIQDASFVPCWGTTAPDNMIEVWANGFNGVPSYSGNQFIELNAFYVSTLFQNFSVAPSTSITVSFAHRGRAGVDTMSVEIGPIGGPYVALGTYGDGNTAWGYYTVGYIIPASLGSNYTLRFNSIYATGGNQAIGNFLDAISVNLPSNSILTLSSTSVSCFGGSNGTAQVSITNGSSPYTYTWSPSGLNTNTLSSLTAGIYTVNITEANGCSKSGTVNVFGSVSMSSTITSQNESCSGSQDGTAAVSLNGASNLYSYTWTPSGANTFSISNLSSGNYSVQIMNSSGCMTSNTIVISQTSMLNVTTTTQSISCLGSNDGTSQINTPNGLATYTYTWLPQGINTPTISGLSAGTYTYHVLSSLGCATNGTINILEGLTISVSITTQQISCLGANNGSASSSIIGGLAPYTYTWLPNNSHFSSIAGLSAGTYSLLTSSSNGCSGTNSITINEGLNLSVTLIPNNISCYGLNDGSIQSNINGGTTPYTYTWNPVINNMSSVSGLSSGTYTLNVTSSNGCSGQSSAHILEPTILSMIGSSQNVTCETSSNGHAQVLVTGGTLPYSYYWSPNTSSINTASNLSIGIYTCLVTDNNLCSVSKTFTISETLNVALISATNATTCSGNKVNLTASGAQSYTWQPGNTIGNLIVFSPTVTTTYTIIGTDINGCITNPTTAIIVVNPKPIANAGKDTAINIDGTFILIGIGSDNYGWMALNKDVLNCNFCPIVEVNPQANTCYILQAYNNFCSNTDTMCITVKDDWNIYIPNCFTPNYDKVNDIFIPVGYGISEIELSIFDRWGTLLFNTNEYGKGWDGTYKGTLCKSDVYIYQANIRTLTKKEFQKTGSVTLLK
jgi:gliding motility-associated-like protein